MASDPITPGSSPAAAPAEPEFSNNLSWERVEHGPTSAVQPKEEAAAPAPAPTPPAAKSAREMLDAARAKRELEYREADIDRREAQLFTPEQRNDANIKAMFERTTAYVREHKDEFELTVALGEDHRVPEVIYNYWRKTGQMLDEHEAAEYVEKLCEQAFAKIADTKKVRGRFAPPPPATLERRPFRAARSDPAGGSTRLDENARLQRARAAMDAVLSRRGK